MNGNRARQESLSSFMLLAITVIWGMTFAIIKDVLKYVSPIYFIFWRFAIAALIVYIIFAARIHRDRGRAFIPGMIIGICIFLGFLTQTLGLGLTTANKSAFITATYVIMVPFLSFFFERKKITRWAGYGSGLGFLGLYILARPQFGEVNAGDILTLFCALAFGFQIVLTNIYTRRHDGAVLLFYELLLTCGLSFVASRLWGGWRLSINRQVVASILYVATLATAFNIYVQNRFQKDVASVKAAIIYTTEPIFAAIFAFFLIGEVPTAALLVGGSLIVGGLAVSEIGARKVSLTIDRFDVD